MNVNVACPACKRARTLYVDFTARTVTYRCNGGCTT